MKNQDNYQEKSILTPEERYEVLNAIEFSLPAYQIDGYEDNDGMFFKVYISKVESGCSEEPNRPDLISRQQAINSTKYIFENDWMYPESQEKYVLEMLDDLPSAQPRIIACSKCKHKIKCFSQIAATNKYQTTTIFYDIDFCSRWENEDNE